MPTILKLLASFHYNYNMKVRFGQKIKELRKEFGITQQQLADALNINHSTVALYETDQNNPSHEVLLKMAEYFDVSLDELYGKS